MNTTPSGMLFVATDVEWQHEADFNRWYDLEHVEERARIPGFISSARYEAVESGPKYLGLYRTESLDAFTTPHYKAAFGNQTPWSITNLERMRNPARRVCTVQTIAGKGSGSWLCVLQLSAAQQAESVNEQLIALGEVLAEQPGFVQAYLLTPDAALSTPLPREKRTGTTLAPLLLIETSDESAHLATYALTHSHLPTVFTLHARYVLKWKLFSAELS